MEGQTNRQMNQGQNSIMQMELEYGMYTRYIVLSTYTGQQALNKDTKQDTLNLQSVIVIIELDLFFYH